MARGMRGAMAIIGGGATAPAWHDPRPARSLPGIGRVALLSALALVLCALAGALALSIAGRTHTVVNRTASLPRGLAPIVSRSFGRTDRAYWPVRHGASLSTSGGGIATTFTTDGARLSAPHGSLAVRLLDVGRGARLAPVASAAPAASADQVRYRHRAGAAGTVEEVYRNGPLGLEQAFELAQRPLAGSGPLTLVLGAAGSLKARLDRGEITFQTRSGASALTYGELEVRDATGAAVPARMDISNGRIGLVIDDRNARYPLRVDPFVEQGPKLVRGGTTGSGEGPGSSSAFGQTIALSENGDTAIVGAPDEAAGGAARIFTRSGATWSELESLPNPARHFQGTFGSSVAISADGDTAIVGVADLGAPVEHEHDGGAYVFVRSGSTWTQQGPMLSGEDESGGGVEFGSTVAISADGDTVAIGGPGQKNGEEDLAGAVWVFTRSESTWTQQGEELTGGEELPYGTNSYEQKLGSSFGCSVALSADGDTLLVGGYSDDHAAGAAWVFTRSGSSWTQQGSKLTPSDESGEGEFGKSVALSGEGDTALIGAPEDDEVAGAAWVFTRSGSSWTQQGSKLTPSDESGEGEFAETVALSGEGDTALIGAPEDDNRVGAAWIFTRSGSSWTQQGSKLTGEGEQGAGTRFDPERGGAFGAGVALSADGSTAMVGGPADDELQGAIWPFVFEPEEAETPAPGGPSPESRLGGTTSTTSSSTQTPALGVLASSDRAGAELASLASRALSARRRRAVTARLHCGASASQCDGRLVLSGWHRRWRSHGATTPVVLGAASFSLAPGETALVSIPLDAAGRALLRGVRRYPQMTLAVQQATLGASYSVSIVHNR